MTVDHPSIVFLFPGQGSQQTLMAAGLYDHDETFTSAIDAVFTAMGPAGRKLRADWLTDRPAVPIDHVSRSTPLLFAIGWALSQTVMSWGHRPAAVLGHSIGEMVAATVAGVFTAPTAARLVRDRVDILARGPKGGMLAVAAPAAALTNYLQPDVAIAAINSPAQTVLSGPDAPLAATAAVLMAADFTCRRVPALSPFHSPAMSYTAALEQPTYTDTFQGPPRIPVYSAYCGKLLAPNTAQDPTFWASHPAMPVLFWPALSALLADFDGTLVELGAGEGLATLARRHPHVASGRSTVIGALPHRGGFPHADRETFDQLRETLTADGPSYRLTATASGTVGLR